jgi:hypothetical protein
MGTHYCLEDKTQSLQPEKKVQEENLEIKGQSIYPDQNLQEAFVLKSAYIITIYFRIMLGSCIDKMVDGQSKSLGVVRSEGGQGCIGLLVRNFLNQTYV